MASPGAPATPPPALHGPYWQFSRAVEGRTVTRWITEEQAALYKEWIANRRRGIGIPV